MKKSLLLIMFVSLLLSNAEAAPIQWDVASGGNGHYYEFVGSPGITWESAKLGAESRTFQGIQGHLATITSNDENNFILNFTPGYNSNHYAWLGGIYNGEWSWITGEEWDYTKWCSGCPTSPDSRPYLFKYYSIHYDLPDWGSASNSRVNPLRMRGYLVEYDTNPSTIPEPSTMLLFGMGCLGLTSVCRKKLS